MRWKKVSIKNTFTRISHKIKKITGKLPGKPIILSRTSLSPELTTFKNHINYFDNFQGEKKEAFMTHGQKNGYLMDLNGRFRPPEEVTQEIILPCLQKARRDTLTLVTCHGAESGSGQTVANITGRKVRCFEGIVMISQTAKNNLDLLELPYSQGFFFKKEVTCIPSVVTFSMTDPNFCL